MAHTEGAWKLVNNVVMCSSVNGLGQLTICKINANISGHVGNAKLIEAAPIMKAILMDMQVVGAFNDGLLAMRIKKVLENLK